MARCCLTLPADLAAFAADANAMFGVPDADHMWPDLDAAGFSVALTGFIEDVEGVQSVQRS